MTGEIGDSPTGGGGNAPWRWLLVIVPLAIMLATITNLLGLWSTSWQHAAREEDRRLAEQQSAEYVPAPANSDAARDQAAVEPAEVASPAAEAPEDDVGVPPQSDPPEASSPVESSPLPGPTVSGQPGRQAGADGFDVAAVVARIDRADLAQGARTFRMCGICHTAAAGADHRIGPNLWNVVGRDKAALADFRYSQALRDKGGRWTDADLAAYLHDPRAFVPGTSMSFAGISDGDRLASLIAYLRTLSDDAAPWP